MEYTQPIPVYMSDRGSRKRSASSEEEIRPKKKLARQGLAQESRPGATQGAGSSQQKPTYIGGEQGSLRQSRGAKGAVNQGERKPAPGTNGELPGATQGAGSSQQKPTYIGGEQGPLRRSRRAKGAVSQGEGKPAPGTNGELPNVHNEQDNTGATGGRRSAANGLGETPTVGTSNGGRRGRDRDVMRGLTEQLTENLAMGPPENPGLFSPKAKKLLQDNEKLRGEIDEANTKMCEMSGENRKLEETVRKLEAGLAAAKEQVRKKEEGERALIREKQVGISNAQRESQDIKGKLDRMKENESKLRDELQRANGELQEKDDKLRGMEDKLDRMKESESKLRDELQRANGEVQEKDNKLRGMEDKLWEAEARLEDRMETRKKLVKDLAVAKEQVREKEEGERALISEIEAGISKAQYESQHIKNELDLVRKRETKLGEELRAAKGEVEEKNEKLQDIKDKLDGVTKHESGLRDKLKTANRKVQEKEDKLWGMEVELKETKKIESKLREELAEMRESEKRLRQELKDAQKQIGGVPGGVYDPMDINTMGFRNLALG